MKIETIEIQNYKAFYGKKTIQVGTKNLFIYGENGSGKSSFYYALKDFFQSSMETINLNEVENIFIDPAEKGKVAVKLTFNLDENDDAINQTMELSFSASPFGNVNIRDTSQLRSFLTYKNLLEIHNIKKDSNINLFTLLVKGVLKHFKPTGLSKSLGETWDDIEKILNTPISTSYNSTRKKRDVQTLLSQFNKAFGNLFIPSTPTAPNPDYILENTEPILQYFDKDIQIGLKYDGVRLDPNDSEIKTLHKKTVGLDINYAGRAISKPHLFLNEARLSAIAISIYLGMIKRIPQKKKMKILFLDDLFIGLDLSNRMPLIQILEKDFAEYQIIVSTYDKPWYDVVSLCLDTKKWKRIEFLVRKNEDGYEVPIISYPDERGTFVDELIAKAEDYFKDGDNKASGVYIRTAFEFILKKYCYKKVAIQFNPNLSEIDIDVYWNAVQKYKKDNSIICNLSKTTIDNINIYRKLSLNPLCHHTIAKHEFSAEIRKTIDTVIQLKSELLP